MAGHMGIPGEIGWRLVWSPDEPDVRLRSPEHLAELLRSQAPGRCVARVVRSDGTQLLLGIAGEFACLSVGAVS